jgi:hypothetical protein
LLLDPELEAERAEENDEHQLFLQIAEIEKQRQLEERQKDKDKYPALYAIDGVSPQEREMVQQQAYTLAHAVTHSLAHKLS